MVFLRLVPIARLAIYFHHPEISGWFLISGLCFGGFVAFGKWHLPHARARAPRQQPQHKNSSFGARHHIRVHMRPAAK